MSFLRRVFGGSPGSDADRSNAAESKSSTSADDTARDAQLLREDAERCSDDLIARQLRFADRKWTPPSQGGSRRADDADAERGSDNG